jgi:hypothetical protein
MGLGYYDRASVPIPRTTRPPNDSAVQRRRVAPSAASEALAEIAMLEGQLRAVERQLATLAATLPIVARLRTVPGVGLLTATALVASVSNVDRFPSGRHFASYLGLTPRERSSGTRRRLGAISKRGDAYLRMLLVHGARAVLWHAKKVSHPTHLQTWALAVERHRGHNKAAVALANKPHPLLMSRLWPVWGQTDNSRGRSRPGQATGSPPATCHHGPESPDSIERPEIRLPLELRGVTGCGMRARAPCWRSPDTRVSWHVRSERRHPVAWPPYRVTA